MVWRNGNPMLAAGGPTGNCRIRTQRHGLRQGSAGEAGSRTVAESHASRNFSGIEPPLNTVQGNQPWQRLPKNRLRAAVVWERWSLRLGIRMMRPARSSELCTGLVAINSVAATIRVRRNAQDNSAARARCKAARTAKMASSQSRCDAPLVRSQSACTSSQVRSPSCERNV